MASVKKLVKKAPVPVASAFEGGVVCTPAAASAVTPVKKRAAAAAPPRKVAAAAGQLSTEEQQIADRFQIKNGIEHVLCLPDTYIGSIAKTQKEMWVFNDETDHVVERSIEYVPGLYKIYDEALVNARDHVVRMARTVAAGEPNARPVTTINIDIAEDGTIAIMNDGNGIPVVMHPEHQIYVPEVIFANLRSGENFNKDDADIIGGKNGYGVKLAFIWSTHATVETVDHERGLRYVQQINRNMFEIEPPTITKVAKSVKPFTRITFRPDYARFGVPEGLTADVRALFKKRAYDIAALTGRDVKVNYNGALIPIKTFAQYIDYYVGEKTESARIYEEGGERWEYAVALSPTGEFSHASFVNGINTAKGGTHVDYIMGQITNKLKAHILQKKKIEVKPATIREQLMLFLRCDIVRPSFDSQSKDYMTTEVRRFGSMCEVSDKFIEKLAKMGVVEAACAITDAKQIRAIARATDGSKKRTIMGIPKLDDAEYAGTAKSCKCELILTEGDSAKSGAKSGFSAFTAEQLKYIGVYPLRGKMMNVRDENPQKIAANKEITDIIKILGLKMGATYTPETLINLRYGKIVIICDSDVDGSHIKGLIINLFHSEWPSLTRIPGFISFMNTPILKAFKGTQKRLFYNQGEYETWRAANAATVGTWKMKYYKGLGTSTAAEWKEYFADKKFVDYVYNGKPSDDKIDMAFNSKKSDERKEWLKTYDRGIYLDTTATQVTYVDFIQRELIHFSSYDNIRSIPNLMDGLKPSLRKILYCAFKRNLTEEVKVAQFTGYIAENSEYHHGEVSLQEAIVGMAQTFMGSNNINLLTPNGAFGTRLQGGEDHASPRYIFTQLATLTRLLFPPPDDHILHYLEEDGHKIEPLYYIPIIPMILVNGTSGIGTGYSTNVPCYNPRDLVQYLRTRLLHEWDAADTPSLVPYYEGFKGTIREIGEGATKFLVKGTYVRTGPNTIIVTELPVGFWTQDFKEHLEDLAMSSEAAAAAAAATKKAAAASRAGMVTEFYIKPSDVEVMATVHFAAGVLDRLEEEKTEYAECNGVDKLLKLFTTISTTNMTLFSSADRLRKYATTADILDEYFVVRLRAYDQRRVWLCATLERELTVLSNRARFILENVDGTIDLRRINDVEAVDALLAAKKYDRIDGKYEYLTKMHIVSLCKRKRDELLQERGAKEAELTRVRRISAEEFWLTELAAFEVAYDAYVAERRHQMESARGSTGAAAVATKAKRKPPTTTTTTKK